MSKPFLPELPIVPEKVVFETSSMTTEEFGAFSLLAYHSWREDPPCSIPSDDSTLARITRMTDERWAVCKHRVLAAFTSGSASRLYHKELRQTFDKLRRKHAARVSAATVAVNSRQKKTNGMNGFHTNRLPIVIPNDEQSLQQKTSIPPHPPGERASFLFSDSEEESFTSKTTVTTLDSSVSEIAQRMYDRHPPVRRCSITVIQKQLRAIVRKITSVPLKIAKLEQVDKSHEEWCACSDWTKDDGQYAKGLDNWLAPSLARWEVPPADAGVPRSQQSTMLSMEEQDRLVREHSERLYGS